MIVTRYAIRAQPKPRMTMRSTWSKPARRYFEYKETLQAIGFQLPPFGYHVICVFKMPEGWSAKKKAGIINAEHEQKPDKDNIEKALLDAIFSDDQHIWDGRISKVWGLNDEIIVVEDIQKKEEILSFITEIVNSTAEEES